jgi:hypothetical protein
LSAERVSVVHGSVIGVQDYLSNGRPPGPA